MTHGMTMGQQHWLQNANTGPCSKSWSKVPLKALAEKAFPFF
jgi:hypothetical protein